MARFALKCLLAAAMLVLPALAEAADPIKLKLSFFTSDRSLIYRASIKPFVDAVNAEGKGVIEIEVYFSGAISLVQSKQPELVASGAADLALIVPARNPGRFHDTAVMELPGLFKDSNEASRTFFRLADQGTLAGYGEFHVVGAFMSQSESIHSRKPIASAADLKGLRIRTNNHVQAEVLERLGAIPVLLPINKTTEAVTSGAIDGAAFPPSMLFEFGIGRVVPDHYMIEIGRVLTALVMNRKTFESLPENAKAIIRKHGGEAFSIAASTRLTARDHEVLKQLKADSRRKVVYPSPADERTFNAVFDAVSEEFAETSEHNRLLLTTVKAEAARIRASE
jgi:TRAP-type C4-dicarboxylate transport system substrate-binding protein